MTERVSADDIVDGLLCVDVVAQVFVADKDVEPAGGGVETDFRGADFGLEVEQKLHGSSVVQTLLSGIGNVARWNSRPKLLKTKE